MTLLLECVVDGQPVPQGSMTPFIHARSGKVVMPQKQAVKTWRDTVALVARAHYRGDPTPDPVRVILNFRLGRPRGHYGTGRNSGHLKASAPRWCTGPPDLDKLTRAIGDAITGVIICDDSQIIDVTATKAWADEPHVHIEVHKVGSAKERVG